MSMEPNTLLILDGTVLVLRPYFVGIEAPWAAALASVRRAMPTASHLAVVMDRTMDTFRRELDPSYKAHRPPAPPELIAHFNRFEAEVEALGVPLLGSLRYEADDMAASLARVAVAQGLSVCIHSDDKDLFQIVREQPPVVLEDTRRKIRYDRAMVHEKLGVWPEQVVDYLSLVGDSVDGIPGVKGIGAKTAAALIGHFGSLDALYADLDAVAELSLRGARTLPDKLRAGHARALHARALIRLVEDIDLGDDPVARCRRPG
jgi:DNA polymerase I